MHPTRHEVWARAIWIALDIGEQGGVDMGPIFRGLPFDAKSVRKLRRVDWDHYCTVVERIEEAIGGRDATTALCEQAFHRVIPEFRSLAGSLMSPKTLVRLIFQVFDPLIFPPIDFRYEDHGENHVRVGAWFRHGVRPCRAIYGATLGGLRGMPRHLGLPPAIVTGHGEEDHMISEVELPPSRTIVKRARRASRRWSLTPRQVEVLAVLAHGKANKEIAETLGRAENTVELHVTQLLKRAGVASRAELIARFWSEP